MSVLANASPDINLSISSFAMLRLTVVFLDANYGLEDLRIGWS